MEGKSLRNLIDTLQEGKSGNLSLLNQTSISIKRVSQTKFKFKYIPNNQADYYSPTLVYFYNKQQLKFGYPIPNLTGIVLTIIAIGCFIYFKYSEIDSIQFLFMSIIIFLVINLMIGYIAYYKIQQFLDKNM